MPITEQDRESLRCAAVRTAAAHGYDAVIITARRGNTLASESYAIGVEPGAPELPSRETYRDALIEAVDRAEGNCPVCTFDQPMPFHELGCIYVQAKREQEIERRAALKGVE